MKALKALVIIMGVAIVAGLTVMVIALVQRAGDGGAPTPAATARMPGALVPSAAGAGAPAPGFGETTVALPPGAVIVETATGGGRIVLRIRDLDGGSALVVIDAATGRRLGLVRLKAGGAGGR